MISEITICSEYVLSVHECQFCAGYDYWEKSETLLCMALSGYIHYELPPEEQNFSLLLMMLNEMNVQEEGEDTFPDEDGNIHWSSNSVDVLFEELCQKKPGCFPVLQYTKFKMAAGVV